MLLFLHSILCHELSLLCSLGILAGIWPCGTISLLGELFGAESKSQVYAKLHTFLGENQRATCNLSKCM